MADLQQDRRRKVSFTDICAGVCLAMLVGAAATPALAIQSDDYVQEPGMGLNEAAPEGVPFKLPEGLTLETPIKGYNAADPEGCDQKYEDQAVGGGEQVRICLVFNNNSDLPANLQMPPGLIFVSRSTDIQNGMITQRIAIEVPAKTRYYQPIFMSCLNSGRDTSALSSEYDMGPVTKLPAFLELFKMLEGKVLDRWGWAVVDMAVSDIADTGEISEAAREHIEAL